MNVKNKDAHRAHFEDLTSVSLKILDFLDMTPCQMVNIYQLPLFYQEEGTSHLYNVGNHFSVDTVRHPQTTDQNYKKWINVELQKRSACTPLTEEGIYKTNENITITSTKRNLNRTVRLTNLGTFTKNFQLFMHYCAAG